MTDYGSTTQRPWGSYPDEKQPSLDAVEIDDATFGGVENPCKRWPRLCGCMGIGVAILLLSATGGSSSDPFVVDDAALAGGGGLAASPLPSADLDLAAPGTNGTVAAGLGRLQGLYIDPKHAAGPAGGRLATWSGMRFVSDAEAGAVTLVGCDGDPAGSDPGKAPWWSLRGRLAAGGELLVDFSPKNGPPSASGRVRGGGAEIAWPDGNVWTRFEAGGGRLALRPLPATDMIEVSRGALQGVFTDPNHYTAGSGTLAGLRAVSDFAGESIALVGSDDGVKFWTLRGHYVAKATSSAIVVDFSPKGGPADLNGTVSKGKITWQDGSAWSQVLVDSGMF